jgi:hypothetical protein
MALIGPSRRMARRLLLLLGLTCVASLIGCGSSPREQQAPGADAAPYEGCSSSEFSLPLVETGSQGRLTLTVVQAVPDPPAKFENVWTVEVTDANGAPVEDVEIVLAEAFMPVHGHAGDPAPTIEQVGSATSRVTIHFTMRGPWEVRLDLASQRAGSDHVVFDVCVAG